MSVTLNEPALRALLETDLGPVGREVRQRAQDTVTVARGFVDDILPDSMADVSSAVDFEMVGEATAVVGVRFQGRVSDYIDQKAANENEAGGPGDWMRNALRVVFPAG